MANGKSSNVSLINIYGLEVIHFEGKYAVRDQKLGTRSTSSISEAFFNPEYQMKSGQKSKFKQYVEVFLSVNNQKTFIIQQSDNLSTYHNQKRQNRLLKLSNPSWSSRTSRLVEGFESMRFIHLFLFFIQMIFTKCFILTIKKCITKLKQNKIITK